MDSKDFQKSLPGFNDKYEWFLVQYDQEPQKLTRKIVKCEDLIWNEELQNIEVADEGNSKEHVLIRDQGKLHLGHILHKGKVQQDCIEYHSFLQMLCMQVLHTPHEASDIMNRLHFNHNFWLLVMYSRGARNEEQVVYAVFHKNDVVIKVDGQSHALMAFVQEGHSTYKGLVVKITNDLSDMVFMMDIIRNELMKSFRKNALMDPQKKHREFHEKIALLDFRMYYESRLLSKAFQAVDKSKKRLEQRLMYLQHVYHTRNQQ